MSLFPTPKSCCRSISTSSVTGLRGSRSNRRPQARVRRLHIAPHPGHVTAIVLEVQTSSEPSKLFARIQQLFPTKPVIAITDKHEPAQVSLALRPGAKHTIQKPRAKGELEDIFRFMAGNQTSSDRVTGAHVSQAVQAVSAAQPLLVLRN